MASDSEVNPVVAPKVIVGHSLSGPHLDAFNRAIRNIIATDIAEVTYAQILDGLPLAEVAQEDVNRMLPPSHPIHEHQELCPGVLEKTREFRDSFDPASLSISAVLLANYRASSPGSRAFNIALIELAAVAVHEIAVRLIQMGSMYHSDERDAIASWLPPKGSMYRSYYKPYSSLFSHEWFVDHDQYPNGVADMAGYWAEARIFGGVVLFDRRDPKAFPEAPYSVWFHPSRATDDGTYRIVQLLDDQRQLLLEFLTSESPNLSVLPFLLDKKNTTREDPEEPIEHTGIYRDIWERKPMAIDTVDARLRDVWDQYDYPMRADWVRSQERAHDWKSRKYDMYNDSDHDIP